MSDSGREGFAGCLAFIIILIICGFLSTFRLPMSGEHKGYVTAIDSEVLCTNVYFKTELSSSQEDSYTIDNDNPFLDELRKARDEKKNITLEYSRNTWGFCSHNIRGIK